MGRALDLILTGRIMDALEALDWGMLTELDDDPLARALEIAEGLAAFPQETMLADRRAAIEGFGLPLDDGLALEAQAGPETLQVAVAGAAALRRRRGPRRRRRRRIDVGRAVPDRAGPPCGRTTRRGRA